MATEFDINLDDIGLDLKTVDINTSSINDTPITNYGGSSSAFNRPSLTVSTSNTDSMPSNTFGDREVDLGLDLLVNKKKLRHDGVNSPSASRPPSASLPTTSNTYHQSNSATVTDIDLDKELNSMNLDDLNLGNPIMSGPSMPVFTGSVHNDVSGGGGGGSSTEQFGARNTTGLSYEDIQKAKFDLLCKFERLREKGVKIPKMFSMSSDYEEMKYEYDRLVHEKKLSNSVKMQRQMLISFVTGIEFLNSKFDPFDLKLDNWSSHVNDSIGDYDDIFEELYEKYKDSVSTAPEIRLMLTLGGSAFMYHINNTMFKSVMPNTSDILRDNPELARQMNDAAMKSMSGAGASGFSKFMNGFGGGGGGSKMNMRAPEPSMGNDDIDALIDNIAG